jgi:hypothetical protein
VTTARRSFLARGAAAVSAVGLLGAPAGAQPAQGAGWQPAREAKDNWLDQIPGKHRMFFDATSPRGADESALFAGNYYAGNKADYGLEPKDLVVVIGLRHNAAAFAFTDVVWVKYGAALAEAIGVKDPKTGGPPVRNIHKAAYDELIAFGAHFAVCDMATHQVARAVARKVGSSEAAVYKELAANPIANTHVVTAGIIAVNRAQERGYALAYVG